MKKKILFLDDNKARHRDMKPHLLHDEAFTAGEAIKLLQERIRHRVPRPRLGRQGDGFVFSEEETGYTVAKWIAENKPKIPLVVTHSSTRRVGPTSPPC
jgi:catalase